MQVNSNVSFNAYEGVSNLPQPAQAPVPATTIPINTASVTAEQPKVAAEQYQAQLDTKKALETVSQNTIINIGIGSGLTPPATTQGGIKNSPLPVSATDGAATGNSVSDKFLESFSKMLEGFLANMNKLLDSFLSKMTDLAGKNPNTGTGTTTPTTNTPSTSTPTGGTSTTPTRTMKTWEQKAAEYIKGDDKGMVAESDLQEAVVKYQIYQKSEQSEQVFISELEKSKATTTNRQSALKTALKNSVAAGAITQAEADFVYSISFKASQFDSELDKISTAKSTGGLSSQNAIQLGAVNLSMIKDGSSKLDSRSIDSLTEA